jgi:hypothetical protein
MRGKQLELRLMIKYMEYIGTIVVSAKYIYFFIHFQSWFLDPTCPHIFSMKVRDEPFVPVSVMAKSFLRLLMAIIFSQFVQRHNFTTQKQLNVLSLIIFNLFSAIMFSAISNEMAVKETPSYHHDL